MLGKTFQNEVRRRPKLVWLMVICLVVLVFGKISLSVMSCAAEKQFEIVCEAQFKAATELSGLERRLESAIKTHEKYLREFKVDELQQMMLEAGNVLVEAEKIKHPSKKMKMLEKASNLIDDYQKKTEEGLRYLDTLDQARNEFRLKRDELKLQISELPTLINTQVQAGYLRRHFEQAETLQTEAENKLAEIVSLIGEAEEYSVYPQDEIAKLDYLSAWRKSNEGLRLIAAAKDIVAAVPLMRTENEKRINLLQQKVINLANGYSSVLIAAQSLELYPKYSCIIDVTSSKDNLKKISKELSEYLYRNDMWHQEFEYVAKGVSDVDLQFAEIDRVFVSAVNKWRDVQNARTEIPGLKKTAENNIDDAEERIEKYDHNNQSDAEDFLQKARVTFRDAGNLVWSDPLQSKSQYEQANTYAKKSYDEVNTTSRHSDSGNIFSSSGDSSSGGSWGSSSGNSGSSWGGDFGGPSGGDYGGPSGGDYGNGDF